MYQIVTSLQHQNSQLHMSSGNEIVKCKCSNLENKNCAESTAETFANIASIETKNIVVQEGQGLSIKEDPINRKGKIFGVGVNMLINTNSKYSCCGSDDDSDNDSEEEDSSGTEDSSDYDDEDIDYNGDDISSSFSKVDISFFIEDEAADMSENKVIPKADSNETISKNDFDVADTSVNSSETGEDETDCSSPNCKILQPTQGLNSQSTTSSKKKVHFDEKQLEQVVEFEDDPEAKATRVCYWEMVARDHVRFKDRICRTEDIINPILCPQHREKVYQQRPTEL